VSSKDEPPEAACPRATAFYRPEYERLRWGHRTLHLFWFRDRDGRKTHQMVLRVDPREPAREVRADLARLSKAEFEAKYAAYRLGAPSEPGDLSS
jgi:hypothetical protein